MAHVVADHLDRGILSIDLVAILVDRPRRASPPSIMLLDSLDYVARLPRLCCSTPSIMSLASLAYVTRLPRLCCAENGHNKSQGTQ